MKEENVKLKAINQQHKQILSNLQAKHAFEKWFMISRFEKFIRDTDSMQDERGNIYNNQVRQDILQTGLILN